MLIATARIGFLVDAAVQGFAVGTGFALVENLIYLQAMPDAPVTLWIVRGLGTAMLQGATTAIFAMMSKTLADRHPRPAARSRSCRAGRRRSSIHSLFNHRLLPPVAQTLVLLVALPLLVLWVFERSERATRDWIGAGLDLDLELLDLVASETFARDAIRSAICRSCARACPAPVVADMFCLLRLELELSVQAKALLLAREAGLDLPIDDDLDASLDERGICSSRSARSVCSR